MHEAAPVNPWVALAYLISGVCFILALRGLSSPASSRRGNRYGMIGMALAVGTTLFTHEIASLPEILIAIAIGAVIGVVTARKIAMTDMPQLVAAFHSLVGMAAVLVGVAAFLNPDAFGIVGADGEILTVSRIELGLGVAIGAITFSGSVIAFLKLNGNMGGKPIMLPGRHVINLGVLAGILGLIAYFTQDQSPWIFWTVTALSFAIGFLLIIPIGGADMPVVVSMLNSYSGWAAAATSTAARPTSEWKAATSCGIAVIAILRAVTMPMIAPMAMAARICAAVTQSMLLGSIVLLPIAEAT